MITLRKTSHNFHSQLNLIPGRLSDYQAQLLACIPDSWRNQETPMTQALNPTGI
jgi:hypothetical protein